MGRRKLLCKEVEFFDIASFRRNTKKAAHRKSDVTATNEQNEQNSHVRAHTRLYFPLRKNRAKLYPEVLNSLG
ncbi:MAG: hypothetical protein LBT50_08605 [Prevotellaceae bacterium]|jgi:hypothetical protein|nr:hypothetical protein [Prevotellaceae bacterium]